MNTQQKQSGRPMGLAITRHPEHGMCIRFPLSQLGLRPNNCAPRILVPVQIDDKTLELSLGKHQLQLGTSIGRIHCTFEVKGQQPDTLFGCVTSWCDNGHSLVSNVVISAMEQGAVALRPAA